MADQNERSMTRNDRFLQTQAHDDKKLDIPLVAVLVYEGGKFCRYVLGQCSWSSLHHCDKEFCLENSASELVIAGSDESEDHLMI